MTSKSINPNYELPFFYDHLLDGTVKKEEKSAILTGLDKKIAAAKEFLSYLNKLDSQNQGSNTVKNDRYTDVQQQLSTPIVDGKIFIKVNQDYNHATYEIQDTRAEKKRLEDEVMKATAKAEDDKKKFHEAVKEINSKVDKMDTTTIAKLHIVDPPLLFHFERVCLWILDVFYDNPPSKYEWDNFRKNVFLADKGDDFKKRVKGLYIPKLYDSQIETCNYISSTRPMFKKHVNDPNLDILLSISEDIVKAYNCRFDYTTCKKTIQNSKLKIIETKLDLDQSDKVSKSSEPYVSNIYNKLIDKELQFRAINLSDFIQNNQSQHFFFKGSQGKVTPFLRGETLATWGEEKDDTKGKGKKDDKAPKKDEKKEVKVEKKEEAVKPIAPTQPQSVVQSQAQPQPPAQPQKKADIPTTGQSPAGARVPTQPTGKGGNIEFDDSFEMGEVD